MFQMLRENIVNFVKTELDKLERVLSSEFDFQSEGEPPSHSKQAFLKITLDFLRMMKQEQLAECLLSSKNFENQLRRCFLRVKKKISF